MKHYRGLLTVRIDGTDDSPEEFVANLAEAIDNGAFSLNDATEVEVCEVFSRLPNGSERTGKAADHIVEFRRALHRLEADR